MKMTRFSSAPTSALPRSTFDRSHGHKTTIQAGGLYPILVDEVYPGDTANLSMAAFARMATPLFPVMHDMYVETFFFFIPNRLLWANWKKMCGEQVDPGDSIDYTIPQVASAASGFAEESIYDYMGVPPKVANVVSISALPFRAYNRVWNEWFRDQNLQDSLTVESDDGPDVNSIYNIQKRGKRHDYFTSCTPWLQKGDAVDLPLGTTAPLLGTLDIDSKGTNPTFDFGTTTNTKLTPKAGALSEVNTAAAGQLGSFAAWNDPDLEVDLTAGTADLSSATAATVNELRQAFQVQRILEKDARSGTRYTEIVRAHFGVTSPDARLQRSEYLGGGSQKIDIVPVPQTSSTDATSPQGNLSAFATAGFAGHGFIKSFTEHGILLGLMQVRADLVYQQGLPRMFSRLTRYDHYWPSLAHLGEQSVLNKEIYLQGTAADDNVFGYQERWSELRYQPSRISGQFRSSHTTPLDAWHLAQDFSSLPTLGDTFIQEDPPIDRVVADSDEPDFIVDMAFNYKSTRALPLYSVPGLVDHM